MNTSHTTDSSASAQTPLNKQLQHAGTITFNEDGILFVGDNITSAVFAFETGGGPVQFQDGKTAPLEVNNVDILIAEALGVSMHEVRINGMAVHPITREVYLSLSRGFGDGILPAIVKVADRGTITAVDINSLPASCHVIDNPPGDDQHFRDRAGDWPVPSARKYHAKAMIPMRTMTVVDLKFHLGTLYIAGISNEEFASTLRCVPYPFQGSATESHISIYHVAHARYETRAPIRAMSFATIDGKDTLLAAYTCSPLVLIPISELKNGAKVNGRTIGDMGNGQPISMVPVQANGEDMIFVTNAGHGPRLIPIAGLQDAKVYTDQNSPNTMRTDISPEYPLGPVGKAVMFVGQSLRADRLNDKFLVSLTRDALSGSLILEALPITPLPMKLDEIWCEFDFQGGGGIFDQKH